MNIYKKICNITSYVIIQGKNANIMYSFNYLVEIFNIRMTLNPVCNLSDFKKLNMDDTEISIIQKNLSFPTERTIKVLKNYGLIYDNSE